ncbi:polysaccharide lyase family 8 super-sandwich domain-containing protein [Paenibacillus sp. MMS20-IR301]|uniref:polysaccharide lyase family 8 super-sandwich domain-containing protein n=1 Tax=Paenibacillus sp. MMS20-IR301 TaxID=2895946 RepID=UPI0028E82366|nr:polysaccharide lyase family 8 super-sandwich domain-containing protein [Paenibacillus sp. MMS20-IR301]WNS45152.1 polysaccharide lyase family 8 super-sandwich domain-containing protein [Paenibacillus sp. MMS20-IR301]
MNNLRARVSLLLIAAVIASLFGALGAGKVSANADEFDTMRHKWKTGLTGGTELDSSDPDIAYKLNSVGQTSWGTMDKSAARTYLWSDLTSSSSSSQITGAYLRIKGMALAYSTQGSALYGNAELKTDIIGALDWMYTNLYNETKSEYDNWWDWEIGTPLHLNDIVVLMYDDLMATPQKITNYMKAVEQFSPDPAKVNKGQYVPTGANLVWKCNIVAMRGMIVKSAAKLTAARDALTPLFDYVTEGDGFYGDGSFIQHNVYAYTGSYGVSLLQELANVLFLLSGSPWEPVTPGVSHVYQWVYNAFEPVIYNGAMMDMVRGRAISRNYEQDQLVGHNTIAAIIRLAQLAPTADAQRMKSMVKAWIGADSQLSFYKNAGLSTVLLAKAIMNDSSITARAENIQTKVFAGMDRAVHLRPGFGFGISMSSGRVGTYESTNGENLKGWYTGAGMTYLYNDDLQQFTDYWPTVNKYRLPGTTVDTMPRTTDGEGAGFLSPKTWAGGTELLGESATVGMDLKGYGSTLTAKKSWFMLNDEVVALGAGISSTDGRTIETTVENRMLNKTQSTRGIDPASPAVAPSGSEPVRHKIYAVSDSGNDGNLPVNTYDNNLGTRWSSSGDGQWIRFDLGKTQPVGYVGLNFYVQSTRFTTFDILVSEDNETWNTVFSGSSSIVDDSVIQVFDFPDVEARYVKLVGHGNSSNLWNSINELQIYAPCAAGNLIIPLAVGPVSPAAVTDSLGSASVPSVKDNDISTFWSADSDGAWLKYDLGVSVPLGYTGISFAAGNERKYSFDIETSPDNTVWTAVYSGQSSGLTAEIQAYAFNETTARYVKFNFHGNDHDLLSKVSEIQLYSPNTLGPVLAPLHTGQKANGDEEFIVNGTAKPAALGWTEEMDNVSYAYLEGTGGYYFPQPATVKGLRSASQGSWSELNTGGPSAILSKNYLTLWLDHGVNPLNKDYAYVLLPGKTAQETADYSSNPDIEILSNNTNIQAVRDKVQHITGANFWVPATVDMLTASNPSSIMLKEENGVLDVAVSDPARLQNKVTYEIFKEGLAVVAKDPTVTVLQLSPTLKFEVNTAGQDGRSHKVKFQYDPSVLTPLPVPTPPPVTPPTPPVPSTVTLVDDLDDFTQLFARSANLSFDRGEAATFGGDTSRLIRSKNTNDYIIYKAAADKDMTDFALKTWFWSTEQTTDFQFYTSPDNITYTPFIPDKAAGSAGWKEVNYSGSLPAGTRYLKIVYMHSTSNLWNPQIGQAVITSKVPVPTSLTVRDEMEDYTKMFAHSGNVSISGGNPESFGADTSRLVRLTNTNEYVIYKAAPGMDLKQFSAKAWFWPYEAADDLQFSTSTDNSTYLPYTPVTASVYGSWNEANYSGKLPRGTQYLKIAYSISPDKVWNPQIGSVETLSEVPKPASAVLSDPLYDFSKMFAHSSNLFFDISNPANFAGDTSRLARKTNTEEYVVYQAAAGMDMKEFSVTSWYWPGETAGDLEFYVSADNTAYTAFTPVRTTGAANWKEILYSGLVPAGTRYLKIVCKVTPEKSWNPQIGKVEIQSEHADD